MFGVLVEFIDVQICFSQNLGIKLQGPSCVSTKSLD